MKEAKSPRRRRFFIFLAHNGSRRRPISLAALTRAKSGSDHSWFFPQPKARELTIPEL